ncbi:MAG: response regulator [Verrucomicrobiota bacterium]
MVNEERNVATPASVPATTENRKILVIDDSLMLLNFVKEILAEANYSVATAGTAQEGIGCATDDRPDLILLDYVLPDMKGDEVSERLARDEKTTRIPIIYMSGFGADLQPDHLAQPNVIGSLNKPFTSDLLLKTVENFMPKDYSEAEPSSPIGGGDQPASGSEPAWAVPEPEAPVVPEPAWPESAWSETLPAEPSATTEAAEIAAVVGGTSDAWWSAPTAPLPVADTPLVSSSGFDYPTPIEEMQPMAPVPKAAEESVPVSSTFFSGDTSFFSLNGALHTIGQHSLTGILRVFWNNATVELLAQNGDIVLATTGDADLYCPEAPITLVNVDEEQTRQARAVQKETGCPFFLTLARQELILREPALQLVEHYGQKLFAQLWTAPRARFVFEQTGTLPEYAQEIRGEEDIDYWILTTLRLIQSQELVPTPETKANSIPAYTRDGYERVQKLRLTVAEAQFASQFNGIRSIAQIAKNLRLDFKFARLTLFRFLALEIIECWPPTPGEELKRRGFFQRMGFGE